MCKTYKHVKFKDFVVSNQILFTFKFFGNCADNCQPIYSNITRGLELDNVPWFGLVFVFYQILNSHPDTWHHM